MNASNFAASRRWMPKPNLGQATLKLFVQKLKGQAMARSWKLRPKQASHGVFSLLKTPVDKMKNNKEKFVFMFC